MFATMPRSNFKFNVNNRHCLKDFAHIDKKYLQETTRFFIRMLFLPSTKNFLAEQHKQIMEMFIKATGFRTNEKCKCEKITGSQPLTLYVKCSTN